MITPEESVIRFCGWAGFFVWVWTALAHIIVNMGLETPPGRWELTDLIYAAAFYSISFVFGIMTQYRSEKKAEEEE